MSDLFLASISTKKNPFQDYFHLFLFLAPPKNTIKEKNLCYKKIWGGGVEVDMGSVKGSKKCKLGKKTILRWKLKKEEKSTVIPRYYFILGVSIWKCAFYRSNVALRFLSLILLSKLTSENRTKGVEISNLSLCLNSSLNKWMFSFLKIHLLHRTFRLN